MPTKLDNVINGLCMDKNKKKKTHSKIGSERETTWTAHASEHEITRVT